MTDAVREYRRELTRRLNCTRKTKERLLSQFDETLSDFLDDSPNPTAEELEAAFGKAGDMAETLLASVPVEEQLKSVRQRKLALAAGVIFALVSVFFGTWLYFQENPVTVIRDRVLYQKVISDQNVPGETVNTPNDTVWNGGIVAELTNGKLTLDGTIPTYETDDQTLKVHLALSGTAADSKEFCLMVLVDGVPAEFTLAGEQYTTAPLELNGKTLELDAEVPNAFSQNLGRLSFCLVYTGALNHDFLLMDSTIYVVTNGTFRDPGHLSPTAPQREGLAGAFGAGTYGAWLWRENDQPGTWHVEKTLHAEQGETLLLEAVAGTPGVYRTILMMDDRVIPILVDGEEVPWLNWKSDGTNMLEVPFTLPDYVPQSGCFYTITTLLTEDDTPTYSSWMIQLN